MKPQSTIMDVRKDRLKGVGLLFFGLFLCLSVKHLCAAEAGTDGRTEPIFIEIERLSPDAGRGLDPELIAPSIVAVSMVFHDGSLDYFDLGEPASAEFRETMLERGFLTPAIFDAKWPDRVVIGYPRWNQQFTTTQYPVTKTYLNPTDHRYLTFGAKLYPSDDAFAGNDNPRQYPIFDDEGEFLGPIIIEIYGRDILDGGVRANDEQGIPSWDIETQTAQPGPPYEGPTEERPIREHPGYNGSSSNPDGAPVVFLQELDRQNADFSQEPYPLTRIRITSGLDAHFSGNWYNPEHDGEGFVLDVTENRAGDKLLGVDWFTYRPDDSGEQLWLHGVGKMRDGVGNPDEFKVAIDLLKPTGGRFASETNPETVEHEPWGKLILQFGDCDLAEVTVEPIDAAFEHESYLIERLTPPPAGTQYWCTKDREYSFYRFTPWAGIDPSQ